MFNSRNLRRAIQTLKLNDPEITYPQNGDWIYVSPANEGDTVNAISNTEALASGYSEDGFFTCASIYGDYALLGNYRGYVNVTDYNGWAVLYHIPTNTVVKTFASRGDVFGAYSDYGYAVAMNDKYIAIGDTWSFNRDMWWQGRVEIYDFTTQEHIKTVYDDISLQNADWNGTGYSLHLNGDVLSMVQPNSYVAAGAHITFVNLLTDQQDVLNINSLYAGQQAPGRYSASTQPGRYWMLGDYQGYSGTSSQSGAVVIVDTESQTVAKVIENPTPASSDYFGYSCDISGNYAIVGAYGDDTSGNEQGTAYLYKTDTGDWTDAYLVRTTNNPNYYAASTAGDQFGFSVAINSTYYCVGAVYEEGYTGISSRGITYVFDILTGNLVYTYDPTDDLIALGTTDTPELAGKMAINENHLMISGRSYKVWGATVDLQSLTGRIITPDDIFIGQGEGFGWALDYTSSNLVVGQPGWQDSTLAWSNESLWLGAFSGAIHLHDSTGAHKWSITARDILTGPASGTATYFTDDLSWGFFGWSVATNDTYVAASAPEASFLDPSTSARRTGGVFIFDIDGNYVTFLVDPNGEDYQYGYSLAMDNNYLVVGSPYDWSGSTMGVVHIYDVNNNFALITSITNPDADPTAVDDGFGSCVAISNNYLIINAVGGRNWLEEWPTVPWGDWNQEEGYVYVYNTGSWDLRHSNKNPITPPQDWYDNFNYILYYGFWVDICDRYYAVGHPADLAPDYNGNMYAGQAIGYVHVYNAQTGALMYTIQNPEAPRDLWSTDYFGLSVKITNDFLLIGVPDYEDVDGDLAGRVYVYESATGTLVNTIENQSPEKVFDYFGSTVKFNGATAAVAAVLESDYKAAAAGAVNIVKMLPNEPFLSTTASLSNGSPLTHISSTWELASDPEFTNITDTVIEDPNSTTSFSAQYMTFTGLNYLRVKYQTAEAGESKWSPTVVFNPLTIKRPVISTNPAIVVEMNEKIYNTKKTAPGLLHYGEVFGSNGSVFAVLGHVTNADANQLSFETYIDVYDLATHDLLYKIELNDFIPLTMYYTDLGLIQNDVINGTQDTALTSVFKVTDRHIFISSVTEEESTSKRGVVYQFDVTDGSFIRKFENSSTSLTTSLYGCSISANDTYLFVGDPSETSAELLLQYPTGTFDGMGVVYVYNVDSGTLVDTIESPRTSPHYDALLNNTLTDADGFGYCVEVHGNYIAITAKYEDPQYPRGSDGLGTHNFLGVVHIFDATTFKHLHAITAPYKDLIDATVPATDVVMQFGTTLRIYNDILVIGAPDWINTSTGTFSGVAMVYNLRSGERVAVLGSADSNPGFEGDTNNLLAFGNTIAINDNFIAVTGGYEVTSYTPIGQYYADVPPRLTYVNIYSKETFSLLSSITTSDPAFEYTGFNLEMTNGRLLYSQPRAKGIGRLNVYNLYYGMPVAYTSFSALIPATHSTTDWQIATDAAFTNIIATDLASVTELTSKILAYGAEQVLYVRNRFHSVEGYISQWGEGSAFTVSISDAPNIETYQGADSETTVVKARPFSSSYIAYTPTSIEWEVSNTADFTSVIDSASNNDVSNNTYNLPAFATEDEYYVRMRYEVTEQAPVINYERDVVRFQKFVRYPVRVVTNDTYMAVSYNGRNAKSYNDFIEIWDAETKTKLREIACPNPTTTDYFGQSMAINDNNQLLVVSMGNESGSSVTGEYGEAFLFDLDNNDTLLYTFANPNKADTTSIDHFGYLDIALTNDYAVVGSYWQDSPLTDSGRVYVWDINTGALLHDLTDTTNTQAKYYGYSVDAHSNYLVSTSYGMYSDTFYGTTYARTRVVVTDLTTGNEIWSEALKEGADTASRVTTDGSIVLINTRTDDTEYPFNSAVFVYDITNGNLLAKLEDPNKLATWFTFGWAKAVNEKYIVIGEADYSMVPNLSYLDSDGIGALYIYDRQTFKLLHTITRGDDTKVWEVSMSTWAYDIHLRKNEIITTTFPENTNARGMYVFEIDDNITIKNATPGAGASNWQIATDVGFTNIVDESLSDSINRTLYNVSAFNDAEYFARVKISNLDGTESDWSTPVTIDKYDDYTMVNVSGEFSTIPKPRYLIQRDLPNTTFTSWPSVIGSDNTAVFPIINDNATHRYRYNSAVVTLDKHKATFSGYLTNPDNTGYYDGNSSTVKSSIDPENDYTVISDNTGTHVYKTSTQAFIRTIAHVSRSIYTYGGKVIIDTIPTAEFMIYDLATGNLDYTLNFGVYSPSPVDYQWANKAGYKNKFVICTDAGLSLSIIDINTGSVTDTIAIDATVDTIGNIAMNDTHVAISYPSSVYDNLDSEGVVYVYNISTASLEYKVSNPGLVGTNADDYFGWNMSMNDKHLIICNYNEDVSNRTTFADDDSGAVHVYEPTTGTLKGTLTSKDFIPFFLSGFDQYTSSVSGSYLYYGQLMSLSGDNLMIGTYPFWNPMWGYYDLGERIEATVGSIYHDALDWQIATDSGFSSIVEQTTDDIYNIEDYTVSHLASGTYYARFRAKKQGTAISNWSATITFTI